MALIDIIYGWDRMIYLYISLFIVLLTMFIFLIYSKSSGVRDVK